MSNIITQFSEGLFWLSLTLFAVMGVAATVAYNFIGRVREPIKAEKEARHSAYQAELQTISGRIRQSKTLDGDSLAEAGHELKKREKILRSRLFRLDRVSQLLHTRNTIILPASFLLVAFVLANIANVVISYIAFALLAISLALVTVTCIFAANSFIALGTIADLISPRVAVRKEYKKKWAISRRSRISVTCLLERGNSLHNLQVLLYLPPCFGSTAAFNDKLKRPAEDPLMPNYNTILSKIWNVLNRDLPWTYDFDRLSCNTAGLHKLYCRLVSEEYTSAYDELDIEVS